MTHSPPAKPSRFFSTSLAIFLIRFFPTLVSLLIMIAFSRQLPETTYGKYQGFWTSYYVLSAIACAGIPAFMVTYTPGYLKHLFKLLKPVQLTGYALWILIMGGLFAWLQQTDTDTSRWVLGCFLLVSALSSILESYHTVSRRFGLLISVNILYASVFLWLHWQTLRTGWELSMLFQLLTVLTSIKLIIYLLVLFADKQSISSTEAELYSNSKPSRLWLHLGVYDVSQMVFKWVDKFIIALLLSSQLTAIYFNGSVEIPFLPVILGAAGSAILMQLSFRKKPNDTQHTVQLMLHSGRLLSSVVFPAFLFFLLFAQELFAVVFTVKYAASVPIFMVSVCVLPLRAYSFTTILQNRHKGALINMGALLELSTALILIYPFYLLWGLPGVALCFVATTYLQAGFYLYHSAKLMQMPVWHIIPWRHWLGKMIVLAIAFIAIHYIVGTCFNMQNALICGGLLTAAIIIIALIMELKQSDGIQQESEKEY